MKRLQKLFVMFMLCLVLAGCSGKDAGKSESEPIGSSEVTESASEQAEKEEPQDNKAGETEAEDIADKTEEIVYIDIPAYAGYAYTEINGNVPYFSEDELTAESYEYYAELDVMGRCGACMASIGQDIMPTKARESIGEVKPTGWHTVKYEGIVDGNYLYNRCHLLGFQLTGENANVKNLITGTRYMNVEGMLPFENMVADYVKETGNHVMYRVTPLFEGNNLVADGVLMEAKSVEDDGEDILFNVFCYNVQPGIVIDYATGESVLDSTATAVEKGRSAVGITSEPSTGGGNFAVNTKNGKIHKVGGCPATGDSDTAMSDPEYFWTYEEAEVYSILIAPGEKKRKCGNCW